jgi:predicted small lipoprotein YifL
MMRNMMVFLIMVLLITACGKKGPLIFPEMLAPDVPSNIMLQQRGNSLKLSFVLPSKDRAGRNLSNLAGVTILKRDVKVGQLPGCNVCMDEFSLFRKLNLELLPTGAERNGSLIVLFDGDVQSGRNYSYILSAFTKENVTGIASVPVTRGLVSPPLAPGLRVISKPTEINLEFAGRPTVADGAFAGYNVYRAVKGQTFSNWPLNREPLTATNYLDVGLERRITYVYVARTVVRLPSGAVVESDVSNEVEGELIDDE